MNDLAYLRQEIERDPESWFDIDTSGVVSVNGAAKNERGYWEPRWAEKDNSEFVLSALKEIADREQKTLLELSGYPRLYSVISE